MDVINGNVDCIDYLERLRWEGSPECPHCESIEVRRRNEQETGRIGRWNCHNCYATFKVTHGTLFHGTKIALQKWFVAIAVMANAYRVVTLIATKNGWLKIRTEMGKNNVIIRGSLRQTRPIIPKRLLINVVLGAVERGGQVVAKRAKRNRRNYQRSSFNTDESALITDQYWLQRDR